MLSFVGLVWDLRPVPKHLLDEDNETWIKNQPEHLQGMPAPRAAAMAVAEEVV